MTTCPACHGLGLRARPGGMVECQVCAEPAFACNGGVCLDPFKCNVALACSVPPREPERGTVELRVGEAVRLTVPAREAEYRAERRGGELVIWRVR